MADERRLIQQIPADPELVSPGMLGTNNPQDGQRPGFDRANALLLMEGIRPDAVFIGDSLTAGWPVGETLADLFPVIVNRGVGGDAVRLIHMRMEADVFQLRPKNLFFMVGTNDVAHRFGYDTDENILADMTAGYGTCFDMIGRSGVRAYVGTVPPVRSMMIEDPLYERKSVLIPAVNERLRQMIDERGFVLLDYYAEMLDDDGMLARDLTTDGCHFTARGYYLMNMLVRRVLAGHPPA